MEISNGKYSSLIGLGFDIKIKNNSQLINPYLKLMIRIKSPSGEWVHLDSKDIQFPTTIEELTMEFESLIQRIEDPDYEDEIAY